ncbi:hypothetical protein DFP73DRAFT_533317 [Morchella snyderi]|nr:hypothetical protein DFP73DRAFT_533317 [Morchella snyderi]
MIHCMLLVESTCSFFSLFLIAYFYDAIYDWRNLICGPLLLCIFWNISLYFSPFLFLSFPYSFSFFLSFPLFLSSFFTFSPYFFIRT